MDRYEWRKRAIEHGTELLETKSLLELAVKELEFCKGTSPFCDIKRINKTLKIIKKSLTPPKKKAIKKTVSETKQETLK